MLLNDLMNYKGSECPVRTEKKTREDYFEERRNYKRKHTFFLGGKPYWSKEELPEKPKKQQTKDIHNQIELLGTLGGKRHVKKVKDNKRVLILIDGDNQIKDGMIGIEKAKKDPDVDVLFICNNEALAEKEKRKYGIETRVVPVEPQATDNMIKTIAGQKACSGEYRRIIIISQDNDLKTWNRQYDGLSVCARKSINAALKG